MANPKGRLVAIFYLFFLLLLVDYAEFISKLVNFYYFHVFRLYFTSLLLVAFGYFLGLRKPVWVTLLVISSALFVLSLMFVWNY